MTSAPWKSDEIFKTGDNEENVAARTLFDIRNSPSEARQSRSEMITTPPAYPPLSAYRPPPVYSTPSVNPSLPAYRPPPVYPTPSVNPSLPAYRPPPVYSTPPAYPHMGMLTMTPLLMPYGHMMPFSLGCEFHSSSHVTASKTGAVSGTGVPNLFSANAGTASTSQQHTRSLPNSSEIPFTTTLSTGNTSLAEGNTHERGSHKATTTTGGRAAAALSASSASVTTPVTQSGMIKRRQKVNKEKSPEAFQKVLAVKGMFRDDDYKCHEVPYFLINDPNKISIRFKCRNLLCSGGSNVHLNVSDGNVAVEVPYKVKPPKTRCDRCAKKADAFFNERGESGFHVSSE